MNTHSSWLTQRGTSRGDTPRDTVPRMSELSKAPIHLQDKVIVVTGASRGIGLAIAGACLDAGAKVVLASRKQADLDGAAGQLAGRGEVVALAAHTGKAEDVEALF